MNRPLPALCLLGLLLAFAAFPADLQAGASDKKKEAFSIRIHAEGRPEDGEKFSVPIVLLDGRKTTLSIMPLLNEHDIKAVYPFKTADGTYGAFLRLDGHGANLLTQYSIEKMGANTTLTVFINGRQVISVIVDKPVKDGIFWIPSGMTIMEEARMVNAFPVMGQENAASQKKKKDQFMPKNIMLPPKASDIQGTAP
jgi:hypothetical protein